ncbi:hypothetical protein HGRIS_008634 [Hohenbuehelia grisea]|uniref:Uncharacterized protein n=1 Tax=Hohenbuehelia grisea TaxID=104357 RepID=A0ABR3J8V0_9AGAR
MQAPIFTPYHIPPLFIATAFTFGSTLPFFNQHYAIPDALPPYIDKYPPALLVLATQEGRTIVTGLVMFTLYYQGDIRAVDKFLGVVGGVLGVVDLYVCWKAGFPGKGLLRLAYGMAFSAWGLGGLSSGGQ